MAHRYRIREFSCDYDLQTFFYFNRERLFVRSNSRNVWSLMTRSTLTLADLLFFRYSFHSTVYVQQSRSPPTPVANSVPNAIGQSPGSGPSCPISKRFMCRRNRRSSIGQWQIRDGFLEPRAYRYWPTNWQNSTKRIQLTFTGPSPRTKE